MKKWIFSTLALVSTSAWAQVSITQFTSGNTISSSAVNTNFNNLKNAVDAFSSSVATSSLFLKSTNANTVSLSAPGSLASSYTLIFPGNLGSGGQVLTTDGLGNLSWSWPGGGGITVLNGDSSSVQNFATGTSGSAPIWSSAGGTHTLNIPMATSAGVSAGLISNSDWNQKLDIVSISTHAIVPGGNNFGSPISIGTNSSHNFSFKAGNIDQITVTPSGKVGVGTSAPGSKLHVKDTSNYTSTNPHFQVEGYLDGASVNQQMARIQPEINQSGSSSYSALVVNAVETNTGAGTKRLLDLQNTGTSQFAVNNEGYMYINGFMGSLTTNTNVTCFSSTPSYTDYTPVSGYNYDFGNSALVSLPAGVYEIILDTPWSVNSGSVQDVSVMLFDIIFNTEIIVKPGRSVKRLAGGGQWQFRLGCSTLSTGSATYNAANSVLGIRRLH